MTRTMMVGLVGIMLCEARARGRRRQRRDDQQYVKDAKPEQVDQLKKKWIWLENGTIVGVNQYGTVVSTARYIQPKLGAYGEIMRWPDFFTTVGRSDLAQTYRKRVATRVGLGVAGGVVAAAGLGGGLAVGLDFHVDKEGRVIHDGSKGAEIALYSVSGVGLVVALAGVLLRPNPSTEAQINEMTDDYDVKLLKDLGIVPQDFHAYVEPKREFHPVVFASPVFMPGGGGADVAIRF